MCRIGRLLFFLGVDYDKGIELLMYFHFYFYFYLLLLFLMKVSNLNYENSFCDKNKFFNLRDKKVWTNMWGSLFSFYLKLCH